MQLQMQIPFGNDNKKSKCNNKSKGNSRSFALLRMTSSKGSGYSFSVVLLSWGISEPLLSLMRPASA